MTEYIKKSDALNAIGSITMYRGSIPFDTAKHRIEDIPADDVRKVVRGKWLEEDTASNFAAYKCSVCGDGGKTFKFNFCSHCGADMRGDKE